ncbi:MAG: hypothetical protein ACI4MR_07900, partial [Candidatus Aphodomorpha sp.]
MTVLHACHLLKKIYFSLCIKCGGLSRCCFSRWISSTIDGHAAHKSDGFSRLSGDRHPACSGAGAVRARGRRQKTSPVLRVKTQLFMRPFHAGV